MPTAGVELTFAKPTELDPTEPMEARLLNISAGGMGLKLQHFGPATARICANRNYNCRFHLPGQPEPLEVVGRLVHLESMHQMAEEALYLGVEFQFADALQKRRTQDQIVRFTTALQRKRLQRQRGA